MQINELLLKNFGKFHDRQIDLDEGINLIHGENESGKSTIHTFIRGMLFGIERGRGRAAQNDTFSIYEPWENPNYYSGILKFKSGEKHFRIERNFDKYSKKAELICERNISKGTVKASIITPRELFVEALKQEAVSIVLLHNHPSGDPTPSADDRLITGRIAQAGALVGIDLLDHIIIGNHCYMSFREEGLLENA